MELMHFYIYKPTGNLCAFSTQKNKHEDMYYVGYFATAKIAESNILKEYVTLKSNI